MCTLQHIHVHTMLCMYIPITGSKPKQAPPSHTCTHDVCIYMCISQSRVLIGASLSKPHPHIHVHTMYIFMYVGASLSKPHPHIHVHTVHIYVCISQSRVLIGASPTSHTCTCTYHVHIYVCGGKPEQAPHSHTCTHQ